MRCLLRLIFFRVQVFMRIALWFPSFPFPRLTALSISVIPNSHFTTEHLMSTCSSSYHQLISIASSIFINKYLKITRATFAEGEG